MIHMVMEVWYEWQKNPPSLFRACLEQRALDQKAKAYNTRDSQDVSDPSTNRAQRCLTCQIGRDGVLSTRYGRKQGVEL